MSSKEVIVWISLGSEDICVGKLWFHVKGSKESAAFEAVLRLLNSQEKMMNLISLFGI